MRRVAGLLLMVIALSSCGDDGVSWAYLAGAWRFQTTQESVIEVFEQLPPDPARVVQFGRDDHGVQCLFREPVESMPGQPIGSFGFRLDLEDGELVYSGLCFGECDPQYAEIQRLGQDQMVIDYTDAPRFAGFGGRVTYTRATDIEVRDGLPRKR